MLHVIAGTAGTPLETQMNSRRPVTTKTTAGPAPAAVAARQLQTRTHGSWRFLAASWGIAAALLAAGAPARADAVTYAFTGVFDVPNGSLNVYTDTSFQGAFTYDPAIPPLPQAQAGAANYDALIAFDLEILDVVRPEDFALRLGQTPGAPTGQIGIDEASNGAPSDAFRVFVSSERRGFIDSPFAWDFFLLTVELERISGSVFDDALSLPSALDLGDFDRSRLQLRLASLQGGGFLTVDGRITSLTLIDTPPMGVPEPGTVELLAIAAGGLSVVARLAPGPRRRFPWHRLVPQAGRASASRQPRTPGDPQ